MRSLLLLKSIGVPFALLLSFLPNHVTHKDTYQQKAFCGVYSDDGNMFLSACQGKDVNTTVTVDWGND